MKVGHFIILSPKIAPRPPFATDDMEVITVQPVLTAPQTEFIRSKVFQQSYVSVIIRAFSTLQ